MNGIYDIGFEIPVFVAKNDLLNAKGLKHSYSTIENLSANSYFTVLIVNNKGADQTVRMRRLVCAFVVRKQQSQFLASRPI